MFQRDWNPTGCTVLIKCFARKQKLDLHAFQETAQLCPGRPHRKLCGEITVHGFRRVRAPAFDTVFRPDLLSSCSYSGRRSTWEKTRDADGFTARHMWAAAFCVSDKGSPTCCQVATYCPGEDRCITVESGVRIHQLLVFGTTLVTASELSALPLVKREVGC